MATLLSETGPEPGRQYPLDADEIVIGRHPECQVVVDVGAVSRRHAKVIRRNGQYYIEDLQSRNGTFLNGERIERPKRLRHGDQIRVCDVAFKFLEDREPDTPTDVGGRTVLLEDDREDSQSTIMTKLDVTTTAGAVQLQASPEAKLAALVEITRSLGNTLALDEVLPKVLDSLFKIFIQADRGFIGLKNEKGVLVPRWHKARREDADETIRVSRTIVNQVMESKEAILSADAASDERFQMSQSIADFRIRSMMCAPLLDSEGNTLGVIQIDTLDQRKRFQTDDLEVLASVAAQAGIAIHNAQMHEEALRQKSLERDLQLAHEVQQGFLPESRPELEGYEFFDYYEPANHVGGDYYDYIRLPDGRLAVIVADVVGHGVAAALMMAKLSAEARFSLAAETQPAAALSTLNDRLSSLPVDRFVTMVMALLDPRTHQVTIVNAGHMAPIHRRADGSIEEPGEENSGLPLGLAEGVDYEQLTIQLAPGESLTMYTDGVNETMNDANECYGIQRIREHLARADGSLEQIGQRIISDVRRFLGQGPQADDMCLVLIRRNA